MGFCITAGLRAQVVDALRHAKRVDGNHAAIRDGIRAMGYEVLDLSAAGEGVPDLAVKVGAGLVQFLEVKDGSKPLSAQKLTEAQERWHNFAWRITSKPRTLEEALESITWARKIAQAMEAK